MLTFVNSCKKDETTSKKTPVITWADPTDIRFGTLLGLTQLNATSDVPGIFIYTPTIGTKLNEGANQNLKVDFTPTDGVIYNTVSKTVKINVISKKDPVITWTYPKDISYGTLLSSSQLNATSDVSGIFVYTPTIGTKLNEGANQNLKVNFSPTDTLNYNSASKTVKINVIGPIVTDVDGNIYHTVTIGTQVWMVENLKTTKYNDGVNIPKVTETNIWDTLTTSGYCWYNNNDANKANYGALYNWFAVNSGKLCPNGWHVPSDDEWTIMEQYLADNEYNYNGTKIENAHLNTDSTLTSFIVPYDGLRSGTYGDFSYAGVYGYWWSSNEYSSLYAICRYKLYTMSYVARYYNISKRQGLSVRCIKD